jgi:hypothetical protein
MTYKQKKKNDDTKESFKQKSKTRTYNFYQIHKFHNELPDQSHNLFECLYYVTKQQMHNSKIYFILSYITIHGHVSVASATVIRVSYKNTNAQTV